MRLIHPVFMLLVINKQVFFLWDYQVPHLFEVKLFFTQTLVQVALHRPVQLLETPQNYQSNLSNTLTIFALPMFT